MSQLDAELSEIMARGALAEMQRHLVSKEKVYDALVREPFTSADLDMVASTLAMWRKSGYRVVIGFLNDSSDPTRRLEEVQEMARDGVLILVAVDQQCELMIIKTADGKGFFGGKKFRYHCYASTPGDTGCFPAGTTSILSIAVTKLSPILRS